MCYCCTNRNSQEIFNGRMAFYLAPHKINENLMKVNEKIIAKNWWNLCKNTS